MSTQPPLQQPPTGVGNQSKVLLINKMIQTRLQALRPHIISRSVLLSSIAVCAMVMGVRQLGALQELELKSFDQLVQLRPDEGPDPRLLVVGVTEEDLRTLGTTTASDQTLDQLFQKLEQYQPRVIGLDIYRNLPVEPGNAELATRL